MSSLAECPSPVDEHLMIDCTLNYKNQEISLPALTDTEVSDVTFIDQIFVHQHNYPLILLLISRTLKVVNGWPAASKNITHYVQLNFSVGFHFKKKFKLLVTQLSHCPVILEYPWLWQHWVCLDFDLHTLTFTHEDCKPHCFNFSVSVFWKDIEFKSCFWEPLPWKNIKSESCLWELLPRKDVETEFCHSVSVLENSQVQTHEFVLLLRKDVEIKFCHQESKSCLWEPQPCHHELKSCHWKSELCCWESTFKNSRVQTHEFISVSSIVKFWVLEICMIGSAPFAQVAQKKNHEVFAISMKDIEKVLNLKKPTDPATVLSKEYHEFLDVFSRQLTDTLPPHQPHDHHIHLKLGSQLIFEPLYGMFRDELLVLKKYLDDNLIKEFIWASFFSAAFPVLFVHKPEDDLWFCVDYRGLNAITIKNCYLLLLIRETLNQMSKTQYFIKLDVVTAFNKLWMVKKDEWLTVFHTHYDLYKYLVMSFGLFNASASFQNYINDILQDYLDVFCTTYIDDILIYSDILKEHRQHVQQVLQKLQRAELQLDIDKCEFHVQEVKYLELIIGVDGIKMDPVKVEAIQTWPTPINEWDVWDFLEFTNFYQWFIKRFFRLVWSLTQLTKKDTLFQWKSDCEAAFQQLKKTFTEAPILQHFDWTHEVTVETDTSDTVVADVLLQKNENSQLQPVAYFSSKMFSAEINYDIYDKELLAIIWVFKEWCSELKGSEKPVQVLCDHKNLEWFMTTKSLSQW